MNSISSRALRRFAPLVFGVAVLAFGILFLAQPAPVSGVTNLDTMKTITFSAGGFFNARDHVVGAVFVLVGAAFIAGCCIAELRRRGAGKVPP